MSDLLYIVEMIALIAAIMWCMYHIGWGDGYDDGWIEGCDRGLLEASEAYKDALDKIHEDAEEDE